MTIEALGRPGARREEAEMADTTTNDPRASLSTTPLAEDEVCGGMEVVGGVAGGAHTPEKMTAPSDEAAATGRREAA